MDSSKVKELVGSYFFSYIKDLEWMTNVDSVTGNIEGSRTIAKWLEERIKALGGTFELRDNGRGAHGIARFKGNGYKKVLLVVHTDTVMGTEGGKRLFKIDENNIATGAGVGDCKASVVQMIYVAKAFKELNEMPFKELTIFFDTEEETGSPDEMKFARELAKAADYAIICDTGRPGWGLCTKRKALARYTIEIKGTSGHAGNAPHTTSNAVTQAGLLIAAIRPLATPLGNPSDFDEQKLKAQGIKDHGQFIPENAINFASVQTNNEKFNVIPNYAKLLIEVRCYQLAEQKRIDEQIKKLCEHPEIIGTIITVSGGIDQQPMEKTPEAAKLCSLYTQIVKTHYNADVVEWTAGGLTIGNTTSEYVPTLDAAGVDTDPMAEHTLREYTDLNTFVSRTVALLHLLKQADPL